MTLVLVYDGGCPFCRHFALRSELLGGLPQLELRDGRADQTLRDSLKARGFPLGQGAVLLDGDQIWHGAAAISQLCARLTPSDPLLALLRVLFAPPRQAEWLYPLLLLARRGALLWKGLPADP